MSNAINTESLKQTTIRAAAEIARQNIKASRARWAALPECAKAYYVRRMEDEREMALRG